MMNFNFLNTEPVGSANNFYFISKLAVDKKLKRITLEGSVG